MNDQLTIRECTTVEELEKCVQMQYDVFALPEIEVSPVRHFIVTRSAGGFTLGAFSGERLVGFVLSVPAYLRGRRAFYSHMTAVARDFQGTGVGARLKWAQRERALSEGVKYIKWTFEPIKARNAHFNLEKLGAVIREYARDFYGTDYATAADSPMRIGLASDRLFAEWDLESEKVKAFAAGRRYTEPGEPAAEIVVTSDWGGLVKSDPKAALAEQLRVRGEFETAFAKGLVCRSFRRDEGRPAYLLYKE